MNKHEQLIQSVAEEMAEKHNLMCYAWDCEEAKIPVEFCTKFARIAVRHMAEMSEQGYFSNYDGFEDYKVWEANCISEMEEKGLIPPTNK